MMSKIKIALLGGDLRQAALAERLTDQEIDTACWGIPSECVSESVAIYDTPAEALEAASAVILPLPVSGDGIFLNCALLKNGQPPRMRDIFKMSACIPVLGGRFSPSLKRSAFECGVNLFDYFDSEELKIRNSVLAAEGALEVAMQALDVSIAGSKSAVTGYGRLARALIPILKALGSDVTVAARKGTDLAWAAASGCRTLKININDDGYGTLSELASGYNMIFNTIPYWIFDANVLSSFERGSLIIDLASAPGG